MTQAERASLERLEDKFDRWAQRTDEKIDGIRSDVSTLQIDVATMKGADGQRDRAGQSRVQWVGVALSTMVIVVALPASVFAILSIVQAVSG